MSLDSLNHFLFDTYITQEMAVFLIAFIGFSSIGLAYLYEWYEKKQRNKKN